MELTDEVLGGAYVVTGIAGDAARPYAYLVDSTTSSEKWACNALSVTLPASTIVSDQLRRIEHPNLQSVAKVERDDRTGATFAMGPHVGDVTLARLLHEGTFGTGRLRDLGSALLAGLAAIHPDRTAVDLLSDEGLARAGLVHGQVRPWTIVTASTDTFVLCGYGEIRPPGFRRELLLIRGDDEWTPPDIDELGTHPSLDLWATARVLEQATRGAFEGEVPDPLVPFFEKALDERMRRRHQDADEMRSSWLQATMHLSWQRAIDEEWELVQETLEDVCRRLGEPVDSDSTARLGRLASKGLSREQIELYGMLEDVHRYLLADELGRFEALAQSWRESTVRWAEDAVRSEEGA